MKRTRQIDNNQVHLFCAHVTQTLKDLAWTATTFRDFSRSEWLGGSRDDDNYETGPDQLVEAYRLLSEATQLLKRAEHEAFMFSLKNDTNVLGVTDTGNERA